MTHQQTCPRCGEVIGGADRDEVADAVVEHAASRHGHRLDRHVVLAHLEGVRPDEWDR